MLFVPEGQKGAVQMPINRLLDRSRFSPEETEILNRALGYTLRNIGLVDRNDPVTEIVARKIIQIGDTGVRDPVEISKIAVRQLGIH